MKYINLKVHSIFNLILSSLFILGVFNSNMTGDLAKFNQSPYNFGPEGRTIQDLKDFEKPSMMFTLVPFRPVVTRDKNGVRQFYTPGGKLILSINNDGSMVFQIQGTTIEKDQDGEVTKISQVLANSNKKEMHDGKGTFLGYQILAFGNNALKEYDSEKNLSKTYSYNEFAKSVDYILDELTQTRTVFDSKGLPTYDINYEGGVVARYFYNEHNVLIYKTDKALNRTYYKPTGEMDRTEDQFGNILVKYNYISDDRGRVVLDTSVDNYGRTTYFKKGKPQYEKDAKGNISKEYYYEDQKLVYTFENETRETVWYDKDSRPLYASIDNILMREWFYTKGKLIGLWEENKNLLIAYIWGDEVGRYLFFQKPTAAQIQEMIDAGIIKKHYTE